MALQHHDYSHQGVSLSGGATNAYTAGAQLNQTNAPRELRIFERLGGIEAGINQLGDFLASFAGRIAGQGEAGATARPPAAGMFDAIGRIEEDLRRCHEIVRKLDDIFCSLHYPALASQAAPRGRRAALNTSSMLG